MLHYPATLATIATMQTTKQPKPKMGRPPSPDPKRARFVLIRRSLWKAMDQHRARISRESGQWLASNDVAAWAISDWVAARAIEKAHGQLPRQPRSDDD